MLDVNEIFDNDRAELRVSRRLSRDAAPHREGDTGLPVAANDLPIDWHFAWDERAAILEFDAGLPRERAEAKALDYVLEQARRGGGDRNGHACS